MKRNSLVTIIIVLVIIIFVIIVLTSSSPKTDEETAKCIGSRSTLYVQLGCHACEIQEKMFGENLKHLNVVDCFFEKDKCSGIIKTPTWIINRQNYEEVQSIEKLKELTGC